MCIGQKIGHPETLNFNNSAIKNSRGKNSRNHVRQKHELSYSKTKCSVKNQPLPRSKKKGFITYTSQ